MIFLGKYIVSKSRNEFVNKLNFFMDLYYNNIEDFGNHLSVYYEIDVKIIKRLIKNNFNLYASTFSNWSNNKLFCDYVESKNSSLIYKNKKDIYLQFSGYFFSYFVKRLEFLSEIELVLVLIYCKNLVEGDMRLYFYGRGMFSLITEDFLDSLSKVFKDKKILEVCSGQGFLGKGLYDRGINIICTDDFSWKDKYKWGRSKFSIEKLDAMSALDKYIKDVDIVLVSWVPYESTLDIEILNYIRAKNPIVLFFVIGEGYGGCTGSELLFEEGNLVFKDISKFLNNSKDRWASINENVYIFC